MAKTEFQMATYSTGILKHIIEVDRMLGELATDRSVNMAMLQCKDVETKDEFHALCVIRDEIAPMVRMALQTIVDRTPRDE